MSPKICPSCGALYNGKKCRSCYYEYSGEIDPGNEKEPAMRKQKYYSYSHKKASADPALRKYLGSLAGFLLILTFIYVAMPILRDWGQQLEAMEASHITPEPMPENLIVLHEEGPVMIMAPKQTVRSIAESGLSLWIANDSNLDILVMLKHIASGGVWMQHPGEYMKIPGNSVFKGNLHLDQSVCLPEITFVLEVRDLQGVLLFETDQINLGAVGPD